MSNETTTDHPSVKLALALVTDGWTEETYGLLLDDLANGELDGFDLSKLTETLANRPAVGTVQ